MTGITNPTPKERFQSAKENITSHQSMTELPAFDRAFDSGMMEYCNMLARGVNDSQSAMSAGFKLQGAIEFAAQVKNLSEQHTVFQKRTDRDNLSAFPSPLSKPIKK